MLSRDEIEVVTIISRRMALFESFDWLVKLRRLKTMSRITVLTAFAAMTVSASAFAAPIIAGSQLNITGFNIGVGGTTIDRATGLDFTDGRGPTPGVSGVLSSVSGTGSFATQACNAGSCGTIGDLLNFASFTPISPFYVTTGGATFNLSSLAPPVRIAGNGSQLATLVISGTGTFVLAGFDPIPGLLTLTTQGSVSGTFSASTTVSAVPLPSPVPEPMSIALLGTGVFVVGLLRRRDGTGRSWPTAS